MQENSRYAVGIDVGTTMIRCVVGHVDPTTGIPTIVGVGSSVNSGMRKGVVANLNGPAQAIDQALADAERMSGYEVNHATVSVNGSHIVSTRADGMIAVGMSDHEVTAQDIARVEDVATTGKVPANREILEVVPHSFTLDGQGGIKDPLGMNGTRLEIDANVVSALVPYVQNLQKASEMATVSPSNVIPSVLAAAKSVVSERQLESGVAVIDIGGSTTGVAVFEEGDLQHVAVIPVGGVSITNDLAIGLKVDPDVAERVKVRYATLGKRDEKSISIKVEKDSHEFDADEVFEIIDARMEEIFESVKKELSKAGRAGQLPSGVILTGGTANLKGIADYAKEQLGLTARIGKSTGFAGIADGISQPEFTAAIGLMLIDSEGVKRQPITKVSSGKKKAGSLAGIASGFLKKFKVSS